MAGIIKKLCINCAYSDEDIEGKHCKRCAENVEDNFVTKEDAKEIREKAIDEFAEKLNTDVESFVAEVNGVRADLLTLDYFSEFVFKVAEQLKGVQNEKT